MKNKIERIIKKFKKINRELNKDKNKYYWKRKYYRLLKEVNEQKKRNDLLAQDLRLMYCQKNNYKHYWYKFCIMLDLINKEGNYEKNRT